MHVWVSSLQYSGIGILSLLEGVVDMLETDMECPKGERGDTGPEGGEEGPGPSWDVNDKEGTSLVGYKMKAAIINKVCAQLDGHV